MTVSAFLFLFSANLKGDETTPHQGGESGTASGTASGSAAATATPSPAARATPTGNKPKEKPLSDEQLAEEVSKNLEKAETFDSEIAASLDDLSPTRSDSSSQEKFDALSSVKKESLVQGLIDHAQDKDTAWAKKIGAHDGKSTSEWGKFGKEDTLRTLGRIADANPKTADKFKGMLENGEAGERILAARVLTQMESDQTATLAGRLKSEGDNEVKSTLLNGMYGSADKKADKAIVDQVAAIAKDKTAPESLRKDALTTLGKLTPDNEIEMGKGTGMTTYRHTMTLDRRQIVPMLTSLIKDGTESLAVREAAFSLIGYQADPTAIPAINHVAAHLQEPAYQPMAIPVLSAVNSMLRQNPDSRIAGGIMSTILPKLTDAMDRQYALRDLGADGEKVAHLSHAGARQIINQGLAKANYDQAAYGLEILSTGKTTQTTRESFRQVVEEALKQDSRFSPWEQMQLVGQAAPKMGMDGWNSTHEKLAAFLGTASAPDAATRERALRINEAVRESLGPTKNKVRIPNVVSEGQKKFDSAFEKQLDYSKPKTLMAEKTLGELIANMPKWNKEDFLKSNDLSNGNNQAWKSANATLGALFLAKSARYNANAQAELDQVVKNVLSNESAPSTQANGEQKAREAASLLVKSLKLAGVTGDRLDKATAYVDEVNKYRSGDALSSPEEVYTKQFFSLFLKEVKDNYPLNPQQKKLVEGALTRTQEALTRDLTVASKKGRDSNQFNSMMNTYGFSTSVLAAGSAPNEAKDLLQAISKNSVSPLTTTYQPSFETFVQTPRGSAARNVPFHLARYQTDSDPTVQGGHRENLIQSLENYVTHAPALLAHVNRGGTHQGMEGLAPYYFYGSIPYATAALNIIAGDPAATAEQKTRVENMRAGFASIIAHAAGEGLAVPLGESTYPSSPLYANPLLGLSILPLLNRQELGVVSARKSR